MFIDLDRGKKTVIFAVPGKGKECIRAFGSYLKEKGGCLDNIAVAVCDMSEAFISGIETEFPNA